MNEQGSDKVFDWCQQADSLVVSVICLPEFISTLSRLLRENQFSKTVYQQLKNNALADLEDVDICQITPTILVAVVPLLEIYPLRTMDALHIACALAVEPDFFISADHRQLAAARKAGLEIVDVS